VGRSALDNRVRALRRGADDMTQQALADAVGVSRQTVIAIERNKYSSSLEVALRIARVFDVTVDTVFWLDDAAGP